MKYVNLLKLLLALFVVVGWSTTLYADSLSITLTEASQTVAQGTTVVAFDATVSNPSATDTIYLNGDSSSTNSLLVSVDDSPFFTNAPIYLAPGASSDPFEIFDVDLDPSLEPGVYTGVFSILGGADAGAGTAFDDLADVNFSVDVTAPVATPEPATLALLGLALAGLVLLRRRFQIVS